MKLMDEFADKLKRDAQQIDAEVGDALRARIDARVRDTQRAAPPREVTRMPGLFALPGVAAGLAALAAVLLFLNRAPEEPAAAAAVTPSPDTVAPRFAEPLSIETVALTEPLRLEFDRLRADLEKARDTIERDLRSSL